MIPPRCMGVTKKNLQCGRRVINGSVPPICHVHAAQAAGNPANTAFKGSPINIKAGFEKLARDSNPQIRLRALDLLYSMTQAKGCDECARDAARREGITELITALDPTQRERISDALAIIRDVRREISGDVYEPTTSSVPETSTPAVAPAVADTESLADADGVESCDGNGKVYPEDGAP